MAAQPLPLTLDEFHRLYDGAKPAYEYWFGEAVQKSMPTSLHGFVQSFIMMLLHQAGWRAATEIRLKVNSEAEPVPDVIAVRGKVQSPYPRIAPDLCIEILSPDDRLAKTFKKAATYLSWGTRQVWVIDPEKRIAWSFETGEPSAIPADGALKIDDTSITLAHLFALVDEDIDTTADD